MSISEGLNTGRFGAMLSNQFSTYGNHFSWMKHSFSQENNVDKVLRKSLVDRLVNFESDEATSKIVDDGTPEQTG